MLRHDDWLHNRNYHRIATNPMSFQIFHFNSFLDQRVCSVAKGSGTESGKGIDPSDFSTPPRVRFLLRTNLSRVAPCALWVSAWCLTSGTLEGNRCEGSCLSLRLVCTGLRLQFMDTSHQVLLEKKKKKLSS